MNKTELLSTYTAEQLAEMVEKLDIASEMSAKHIHNLENEIIEKQSEIDKYRKAFEDVKKERDCQIAEYQKKIEELTAENAELHCELQAMKVFPDEFPIEPIKVADILINAKGEYEHNSLAKALYKEDKGTYRIFGISELREIVEHLLVYYNHNREVEK